MRPMSRSLNYTVLLLAAVMLHTLAVPAQGSLIVNDRIFSSTLEPEQPEAQQLWVTLSQTDVLFSATGQTETISAHVEDAEGNVVPASINWESTDPAVAQIDASGVVTANALGSATLVARADGAVAQRVHVAVAKLASNAALVSAAHLLNTPEIVSVPEDGDILGVVLDAEFSSEAELPTVGQLLILSDWRYAGLVNALESVPGGTKVTIETGTLEGAFETLRMRYRIPLNEGLDERRTTSKMLSKDWDIEGDFEGPGFSCKSVMTGTVEVNTDIDPTIIHDLDLHYEVDIENFATELAQLYVEGNMRVYMDGTIEIGSTVTDKFTCTVQVIKPFWAAGPLQVQFPLGMGFTFAPAIASSIQTQVSGYMDLTGRYGMQFSAAGLLESLNDTDVDTSQLDISHVTPEISDEVESSQVKGTLDVFVFLKARAALAIGALDFVDNLASILNLGNEFARDIDETRVGVRAILDVAGLNRQVRHPEYAPKVDLEIFTKHIVPDPFIAYSGFLGGVFYLGLNVVEAEIELFNWLADTSIPTVTSYSNWEFKYTLAALPTGLLTVSSLYPVVGEEVTFALDLSGLSPLGIFQPERIEIYQLEGEGLSTTATLFHTHFPVPGETHAEWTWTPDETDAQTGFLRFLPFIKMQALDQLPLKLDSTPTGLEVGGVNFFDSIVLSTISVSQVNAIIELCDGSESKCEVDADREQRQTDESDVAALATTSAQASLSGNYVYEGGDLEINVSGSASSFAQVNSSLAAPEELTLTGTTIVYARDFRSRQCNAEDDECASGFSDSTSFSSVAASVMLDPVAPEMAAELTLTSDRALNYPNYGCVGKLTCTTNLSPFNGVISFVVLSDRSGGGCQASKQDPDGEFEVRTCEYSEATEFALRVFPADP